MLKGKWSSAPAHLYTPGDRTDKNANKALKLGINDTFVSSVSGGLYTQSPGEEDPEAGSMMRAAIEQIATEYSEELDELISRKYPREREIVRQISLDSSAEIIKWRNLWLELIRRAKQKL